MIEQINRIEQHIEHEIEDEVNDLERSCCQICTLWSLAIFCYFFTRNQ
jgi:hypothetical protein